MQNYYVMLDKKFTKCIITVLLYSIICNIFRFIFSLKGIRSFSRKIFTDYLLDRNPKLFFAYF